MTDASTTEDDAPNAPDSGIYIECMREARERLHTIVWLSSGGQILKAEPDFVLESMFLQFRKVLELIAFGSLTANKEKYAAAHAQFASHWKAAKMLGTLKKINPDFYPLPLTQMAVGTAPSGRTRWHYNVIKDGFITPDEFVTLYDASSRILHTRNPFSSERSVEIKYDIPVWVERIRRLLRLHSMHLVSGQRWIVYVPDAGKISVHTASPDPSVK